LVLQNKKINKKNQVTIPNFYLDSYALTVNTSKESWI